MLETLADLRRHLDLIVGFTRRHGQGLDKEIR